MEYPDLLVIVGREGDVSAFRNEGYGLGSMAHEAGYAESGSSTHDRTGGGNRRCAWHAWGGEDRSNARDPRFAHP